MDFKSLTATILGSFIGATIAFAIKSLEEVLRSRKERRNAISRAISDLIVTHAFITIWQNEKVDTLHANINHREAIANLLRYMKRVDLSILKETAISIIAAESPHRAGRLRVLVESFHLFSEAALDEEELHFVYEESAKELQQLLEIIIAELSELHSKKYKKNFKGWLIK